MTRLILASAVTALFLMAGAAQALTFAERVERQLRAEGFENITISRTLLGRTRILALGPLGSREIIIDPRNGQVLRDFWVRAGKVIEIGHFELREESYDDSHSGSGSGSSGSGSSGSGGSGSGGSGSGGGGDDDEHDDDDDDDDDDEDDDDEEDD